MFIQIIAARNITKPCRFQHIFLVLVNTISKHKKTDKKIRYKIFLPVQNSSSTEVVYYSFFLKNIAPTAEAIITPINTIVAINPLLDVFSDFASTD